MKTRFSALQSQPGFRLARFCGLVVAVSLVAFSSVRLAEAQDADAKARAARREVLSRDFLNLRSEFERTMRAIYAGTASRSDKLIVLRNVQDLRALLSQQIRSANASPEANAEAISDMQKLHESMDSVVRELRNELGEAALREADLIVPPGSRLRATETASGASAEATVEGEPVAMNNFPVPCYNSLTLRRLSEELQRAQSALHNHLRRRPGNSDINALARWQAERDQLLARMIMAEEKLAWEAGGPFGGGFTLQEINKLQTAFRRFAVVRERFAAAAQLDDKARAILAQMNDIEEVHNNQMRRVAAGSQRMGTYVDMPFIAFLRIVYQAWSEKLREVDFKTATARNEIAKELEATDEILAEIYATRRTQGIQQINERVRLCAESEGRPMPARPFRIHRPTTRREREEVERQLLEFMYAEMSGSQPVRIRGSGSWFEQEGQFTNFDQAESTLMANDGQNP